MRLLTRAATLPRHLFRCPRADQKSDSKSSPSGSRRSCRSYRRQTRALCPDGTCGVQNSDPAASRAPERSAVSEAAELSGVVGTLSIVRCCCRSVRAGRRRRSRPFGSSRMQGRVSVRPRLLDTPEHEADASDIGFWHFSDVPPVASEVRLPTTTGQVWLP